MTELAQLSAPERAALTQELEQRYNAFKAQGLKLDMTRGKPSSEQLDLASKLTVALSESDYKGSDGSDGRNYGGLDGLPEMKAIFAEMLGAPAAQVVVGGASSLTMMHDTVVRALLHGVPGGSAPWAREKVKFICPSPGYDRHFAICEHHGIEMLTVALNDDGPDLAEVERLVAGDPAIKGMWCVPKYSNPTGTTYSDSVVKRLASMKTAAPDFRLLWDNAYAVHDLYPEGDKLANVLTACAEAATRIARSCSRSTSKISSPARGSRRSLPVRPTSPTSSVTAASRPSDRTN